MTAGPFEGNRPTWGGRVGDRSQTATIGITLVFALVIVTAGVVLVTAAGPIDQAQGQIEIEQAEKTLTQLDAEMAKVALGETSSGSVELGVSDTQYSADADAGWIKVKRAGAPNPLPETDLGEIRYERDGTTVAYQGGGVWKKTPGGGMRMVSPPEFHFRNGTLTLPVIALSSSTSGSLGRRAAVRQAGSTRYYPSGSNVNPVEEGVTVVVKSEYYEAWGEYFKERTGGIVEYDHPNNIVRLQLVTPIGNAKVKNGLAALSSAGEFKLSGQAGKTSCTGPDRTTYADSYDSTIGAYCDQVATDDGDIVYGGRILIKGAGGSRIQGMLKSDEIWCSTSSPHDGCNGGGKPTVFGDIKHITSPCAGGECSDLHPPSPNPYSITQISDIDSTASLNGFIDRKGQTIKNQNDNGADADVDSQGTSDPTDDVLDLDDGDGRLTAGTYYLKNLDLSTGNDLELDTSGGDIVIYVEEWVDVAAQKIEVTGSNPNSVKIYVKGTDTISGTYHFNIQKGGKVSVPDDRAPKLRVVGKSSFKVGFGNYGPSRGSGGGANAVFQGVIYAPIGSSGTGKVDMKQTIVYGGIVTGDTLLDTKSSIHYDSALSTTQVISPNAKIAKITYLHVSVNEVEVDG